MKKIIIFLLLVILGFIAWGQYKEYKRFTLESYEYQVPENIASIDTTDDLLLDYYEAVEQVNGYVITQWSANEIDVRVPEDDDEVTQAAVKEYGDLLAKVKYYENLILSPKETPKKVENKGQLDQRKELIRAQFYADPKGNELRLGDRNALVFEIQRILIAHGDSILHDGLFRQETFNALRNFEQANGLFPDGKLDALTLEKLLD